MAGTTALLALPYPQAADANNVPADILSLANRHDAIGGGIARLTTTARDALAGVDLWDGRVIYNTTLARFQHRIGGAWGDVLSTFYDFATWTLAGEVKVASGDTDYVNQTPVPKGANELIYLDKIRYKIKSGTNVGFKMQINGADATGFTGLTATTSATTTDPANIALSDLDELVPVVGSVTATPKNMYVMAAILHVVTAV